MRCGNLPAPLGHEWEGREIDPAQFSRAWFDIPYAEQSSSQKMDIYLPEEGEGPFPVILYIPGGGWRSGDKRASTHACVLGALSRGYAFVIANYRYSTEAHWPAQIFDVKAALRFARAHAHEYQLDGDRLAVWGNSSGGHLANMLAATGASHVFEDPSMGNPDQSCKVDALVSWYAPTDLAVIDSCNLLGDAPHPLDPAREIDKALDESWETLPTPEAWLLGFVPRKNPQAAAMASPYYFVNEDFPPALYQNGLDDEAVPWTLSVAMARKVNDVCGAGRALFEGKPGGHGTPEIKNPENVNRCVDFIDRVLFGAVRPHGALREIKTR